MFTCVLFVCPYLTTKQPHKDRDYRTIQVPRQPWRFTISGVLNITDYARCTILLLKKYCFCGFCIDWIPQTNSPILPQDK